MKQSFNEIGRPCRAPTTDPVRSRCSSRDFALAIASSNRISVRQFVCHKPIGTSVLPLPIGRPGECSTSCCATAAALQNASVTSKDVHIFSLIFRSKSSDCDSIISVSSWEKCFDVLGIDVTSWGSFESSSSESKYELGMDLSRRFLAIAPISL